MNERGKTSAGDKYLSLQQLTENHPMTESAHILYMFRDYEKYIQNAADFVVQGLDSGQNILLVEDNEFFNRVTDLLLSKGYTKQELNSISFVSNYEYYLSDQKYDSEVFVKILEPYIHNKVITRVWGQVLVQDSLVSELKRYECECDLYMEKKSVIAVCSYNSVTTPAFIQNEMLKMHQFLMLDDQIEVSPFYSNNRLVDYSEIESSRLEKIERENQVLKQKNEQLLIDYACQKEREEQLKLAKLNAEKANHMKNVFLSQMSHDLRTPLNIIQGYSQIILMDEHNRYKNHVQKILDASKHLLELIEEILDLSAIESGKISINLEKIQLNAFLQNCVNAIFETDQSEIMVEIANIDQDIFVQADSLRLNQVITNLLNNAIKYNKLHGKVFVYTDYDEKNEEIKIYVEDCGIGIPKDELDLIFTPFYRSKSSMGKWKGTGLGLAIVTQLTERMNGKVGVTSVEGEGSTFWVSFKASLY